MLAQNWEAQAVRWYRRGIAMTASCLAFIFPIALLIAFGFITQTSPIGYILVGGAIGLRLAWSVWPKAYHTRRQSLAHLVAGIGFVCWTALVSFGLLFIFTQTVIVTLLVAVIGLIPLYLCETAFDRSLQSPTTST